MPDGLLPLLRRNTAPPGGRKFDPDAFGSPLKPEYFLMLARV